MVTSFGKKEYTFPRPVSEFGDMAIRGTSDPVVDESRVYVGFADGTFWALSQNDGKVLWEKNLATQKGFNDVDGPVLLDGDRLYVSSFEGNLTAFSRKDGKALWTKEIGTAVKMLMVEEGGEKNLFVSGTDSILYYLNPKTGEIVWKLLVGKGALTTSVYYQGILAVGLSSGTMNFIDSKTGKLLVHRFAKKAFFPTPILDEDKIYYLSNGGRLYSLRFKIK
ncbi:MAG: PQQ-binding-like beta-propeller repeat protein [Deltaproteobacteria bacterium]|nr:MAG: PQQ-binding-like beta-propeller repeat protein [Deltaproteobacteria bacterium]